MMRYALLLCSALIAAVVFGCMAPGSTPPPPPAFMRTVACSFDAATKVSELDPSSDPAGYTACALTSNPTCLGRPKISSHPVLSGRLPAIQTAVQKVFDNSPPDLQFELCTVDQVFIDPNQSAPNWGLRDPRSGRVDIKWIGISVREFPEITVAPLYAKLETDNVKNLLLGGMPLPGSDGMNWLNGVSHNASPDNPTIQIMAILAHEMGHIMWWAEEIPDVQCPAGGARFASIGGWLPQPINNRRGFHGFGADRGNHSALESFSIQGMRAELRGNAISLSHLTQDMVGVYKDGNWADLFSFVDPDEDFIETYKFWALTHAQGGFALNSLSIQFPGSGGLIPIVQNGIFGPTGQLSVKRSWTERLVQPQVCG